jgi:hypothetical protein
MALSPEVRRAWDRQTIQHALLLHRDLTVTMNA